MMDYNFIKCLNPKRIINPYTKESVIAECGQCEACRLKQAYTRTMRCNLESLAHKYCFFVTLTYATEYLPLIKLVSSPHYDGLSYQVYRYRCNSYDYDENGNLITTYSYPGSLLGDVILPDILCIPQLQKKMKFSNDENLFYVLDYHDVQLFLKRLRKKVNERIRVFTSGEYGCVHFRPHYHLLLWFDREETLENILQYINDCWKFGRVDGSLSLGGTSSYVARYVNGNQYLPSILKVAGAKPFSHHSKFLGESLLSCKFETYETDEYRRFAKQRILCDGFNSDVILWRSAKNRVFPRCAGFNSKSEQECIMSYRLNETARSWTGEISSIKNARLIADYIDKYDTSHPVPIIENMLQYFISRWLNAHDPLKEPFDKDKFQRMIYVELSLSRRFIRDLCNGNPDLIPSYYRKVKEFYNTLDYDNLVGQLKYVNDTPDDMRHFYYHTSLHSPSLDVKKLKETILFKEYRSHKRLKYSQLMKHRELNDKNLIFNY